MISLRERFMANEWNIVCQHDTPYKVQRFLNALRYNDESRKETLRSFRGVITNRTAHCLEAALTAAVERPAPPLEEQKPTTVGGVLAI